jgi:hypothetical protein
LHISAVIGGVAVLMLALYCIADIDGFVAKYNVDKYLANPESTEIDVNYLSDDLSVAAVPQLERLMENSQDELIQKKAQAAIFDSCMYADLFDGDNAHLGRWSLDRQRAMNILQKYNMKYSDFDYYHAYENDYDDDYSYEDYEDYYEYY